jgi:hypothetical protein
MGGWRCLGLKTLPSSPPRVPVEDALQEVPEEGQQEEEDAVNDAPSVGAAAIMATEALDAAAKTDTHASRVFQFPFIFTQLQHHQTFH